jgi:cell division protein FtsA
VAKETQVVGLDVGTFGTRAVSLLYSSKDVAPRFLGYSHQPSKGIRKGQIIHIEDTVAVIGKTLSDLERQVGLQAQNIHVGITGSHIRTMSSHGVVAIRNNEVRPQDLKRVVEAAQAVLIPADREVLHIIPQSFSVDGQTDIKDPLGISGVRLEARVRIVTAAAHGAQNLIKCVNRCGYSVAEIVFSPISVANSLLSPEEIEQGVVLVDIGAGTTEIALFHGGGLAAASVLPIGGHHITNDLAAGLRTAIKDAEELKLCLDLDSAQVNEMVTVPELGREELRAVPGTKLRQIVNPRLEEMFSLIAQEIRVLGEAAGLGSKGLTGGVIVTGGTAKLHGVVKLAEDILKVPTRVKQQLHERATLNMNGVSFSESDSGVTAFGLARFDRGSSMIFNQTKSQARPERWTKRVANWFTENF